MKNTNELKVVEQENQRVLLTSQLAVNYGTLNDVINKNYSNNKDRYIEGKHFYCLKGDELKEFKAKGKIYGLPSNINKLYLWTEKGALLHAKSLNTDQAWEVYDKLVDTYFKVTEEHPRVRKLTPRKKAVNQVFRQEMDMAKTMSDMVGVDKGIAFSVAIDRASKKTGEDLSSYMKLLPVATHQTGFLNPTQIGEQIGKSARAVNMLLEERGLQTKIEKAWRLTDEGKKYAEEIPYTKNGHSGYQLQWHEGIVDLFVAKEVS